MFMSPSLSEQFARERQREMLAQASRQRLAREVRNASLAARRAEGTQPRASRLFRRTRPAVIAS
jgi:hypothetical protein